MIDLQSDTARGWGVSIVFHALLLLILLTAGISTPVLQVPEEIEIEFYQPKTPVYRPVAVSTRPDAVTSNRQRAAVAPAPVLRNRSATRSMPNTSSAPRAVAPATRPSVTPPPVPRTATTFEVDPTAASKRELDPDRVVLPGRAKEDRNVSFDAAANAADNASTAAKASPSLQGSQDSPVSLPASASRITWKSGTPRTRTSGRMPIFPAGSRREAHVTVQFTVTPSGRVRDIIIVEKGDPRYEQAAVEAVRTWRFNPLAKSMQQVNQLGEASFFFRLR